MQTISRKFQPHLLQRALGAILLGLCGQLHVVGAEEDGPVAAPFEDLIVEPGSTQAALQGTGADRDGSLQRLYDYGITPQQLAAHADGQPLEKEAQSVELMLKLLLRLDSVPPGTMRRWALGGDAFESLTKARPGEQRGLCYAVSGRVMRVQEIKLEGRDADRLQFRRYYRCSGVVGPAQTPVTVYTRHVPRDWLKQEKVDERISLMGIYLGRGAPVGDEDALVMVAPRLSWHSDSLLGDLGVDVGLFGSVTDGSRIARSEQEVFYQILAAAGRTGVAESLRNAQRELKQRYQELLERRRDLTEREPALKQRMAAAPPGSEAAHEARSELNRHAGELARLALQIERVQSGASELLPMLEDPRRQQGKIKLIRCLARRIVEVKITDPDIRRRYDMDHYYQIDALGTLELTVRVRTPQEVQDGKVNYDTKEMWSYPVTFCVRTLPEGLSPAEQLHEEIVVPAFFFKNWSYDTSDLEGHSSTRRVAPLLIGREPIRLLPPPSGSNTLAGVLSGVLFAVVVAGIWLAVWRAHRADRQFQSRLLGIGAGGGGVTLEELDIQVAEAPNFRHLSEPANEPAEAEEVS